MYSPDHSETQEQHLTVRRALRQILFGLALICVGSSAPILAADRLLISDVTIVSAERSHPLSGTSVLIEDGVIIEIGREIDSSKVDETIDGNGRFLVPGLIDSHVHLGGGAGMRADQRRKNIKLLNGFHTREPLNYLAFGFTTLIDVSSTVEFAQQWNELELRPDLHYCISLPFANGYGMAFEPADVRFETPYFLYDPNQSELIPDKYRATDHSPHAVIDKVSLTDAVCVKTYFETGFGGLFDFPVPTVEILGEVVKEAHKQNLIVLMHGNSLESQQFAVDAGVDVIAHGAWHWDAWNSADSLPETARQTLDDVIRSNIGYQSTAQVIYGERDLFDTEYLNDPRLNQVYSSDLLHWYRSEDARWFRRQLAENYRANPDLIEDFIGRKPNGNLSEPSTAAIARLGHAVSYLADNGATFVFGTDSPSSPAYTNPPGYNGLIEIGRLADLGLDKRLIFEALTINNARLFNLDCDVGTVETGKRANLLLMRENPLETITAYDSIDIIILRGRSFARDSLLLSR